MSEQELISRLLALPAAIAAAEEEVLEMEIARRRFESVVELCQDRLLLGGSIDGKNSETRSAQLRAGTVAGREQLAEVEESLSRRRITLHQLQNQHASLRAIARVMGGTL